MRKRNEDELREWCRKNIERNEGPMSESAIFASLLSGNYKNDPLCALQLGLAIMMDKPLVLIVDKSQQVPKHLVRIAERIEYIDMDNKEEYQRAVQAITETAEKFRGSRG